VRLAALAPDLSPVKGNRPFRNLIVGDAVSVVGTQVTTVAIPLQVYEITRSSGAVGLVGLVGLLPLVLLGLYGGAIADAVDRRRLVILTTCGQAVLSAVLLTQAVLHLERLWLLYAVIAVQSGLFAVDSPARQAFVPRLVAPEQLAGANALRQVEFNIGVTIGPLLAGVLATHFGFATAYGLDAVSFAASILAVYGLPSMPPEGGGRKAGLASVVEGLVFLRRRQILLTTFVLDLIAMVMGMPRALFPAFAAEVYGGGEQTAGLLYSALAVGALLGALTSGWVGRVHRHGIAIAWAVAAWGAAVAGFGISHWLWLGLLMLALAGAADMVSAVFRVAVLQVAAPDELRGRINGVFTVVVAGGPRLGDGRAGGTAAVVGPEAATLVGGLAVIGLTGVVLARSPRFRAYDTRSYAGEALPEAVALAEAELSSGDDRGPRPGP
jgi:MFS family permease